MRTLATLALASFCLAFTAQATTPSPLVSEAASGDPDLGQGLQDGRVADVAFMDANGNGAVDAADPDEPVYLDADANHEVTYGDVRLTAFLRYAVGTGVDVANRDVGHALTPLSGWFAHDGSTWYLDGDSTATVTVADLRFGATVEKVRAGDAALGHALTAPASAKGSISWLDVNHDGRRALAEPLFLDTDPFTGGGLKVSIGDLRVTPQGAGLDDEATRPEVEQVVASHLAAPSGVGSAATSDAAAPAPPTWRTLDWILVVVGVANLAGFVVVGRLAAARHPKSPFK
ncbi:MAG: hypothetical protein LC620_01995 [Halobacteriales archaeon]|nr:hypothetical protein [Halobacteriales archaeon]